MAANSKSTRHPGFDNEAVLAVIAAFETLNEKIGDFGETISPPSTHFTRSLEIEPQVKFDRFLQDSYAKLWQYVEKIDPRMKNEYLKAREDAAQCYAECSEIVTAMSKRMPEPGRPSPTNGTPIKR